MTDSTTVLKNFEALANDLYMEGYCCGIDDDSWFAAWAVAMQKVAAGEKYTDDLVIRVYKDLREQ